MQNQKAVDSSKSSCLSWCPTWQADGKLMSITELRQRFLSHPAFLKVHQFAIHCRPDEPKQVQPSFKQSLSQPRQHSIQNHPFPPIFPSHLHHSNIWRLLGKTVAFGFLRRLGTGQGGLVRSGHAGATFCGCMDAWRKRWSHNGLAFTIANWIQIGLCWICQGTLQAPRIWSTESWNAIYKMWLWWCARKRSTEYTPEVNMEPKYAGLEDVILFKQVIFRFHINLPQCNTNIEGW